MAGAGYAPGRASSIARPSYALSTALLPTRVELPELLNRRGLLGRGAEVGVKLGFFSDHLLSQWRGQQLISIDPWLHDDPDSYVDTGNVQQGEQETYYRTTLDLLAKYGERSSVWRMTSLEAAERIADNELDFVYIDARHDYHSVREDLETWLPKVRPGGILAGHDYLDGEFPEGRFGVKSAVDEVFGRYGLTVHSTFQDTPWISWVVALPDGVRRRAPRPVERTLRSTLIAARSARRSLQRGDHGE
jgi:hypothetical protein